MNLIISFANNIIFNSIDRLKLLKLFYVLFLGALDIEGDSKKLTLYLRCIVAINTLNKNYFITC